MLPQNFSESLKCYPYSQFIFLLCSCVIKARQPGEAGGQATFQAERGHAGLEFSQLNLPICPDKGPGDFWLIDTPCISDPVSFLVSAPR